MKRSLGMAAALAASLLVASSQQYQPGPYAPRQPYPTRPATPYLNPALSNYYRQNALRQGYPLAGRYPTNPAPGIRTNVYAPGAVPTNYAPSTRFPPYTPYRTNATPGNRFAPNPLIASNYAPGTRLGARPYSYTNVLPRAGFQTNSSRFAPTEPNVSGYVISPANPGLTNAFNTNRSFSPPPGTTNFLVPNSTNAQSRLALTPAQRRNIDRLSLVMNGIKSAPVTSSQRQQLLSTVRASALGAAKPSDAAVSKLVDDLVAAWPTKGFAYQQKFQLAVDVTRVLNCGNLNQGEVFVVVNDARRVLRAIGVSGESASTIVDDLNAVAAEVQKTQTKESAAASEQQN